MGTPALIIQKTKDGYRTITCSMDGYPGGNGCGLGHRLLNHYNDDDKVSELMELGCVRILGNTLAPQPPMKESSTNEEELKRLKECMNYSDFHHRDGVSTVEQAKALETETMGEATKKRSYYAGYHYLHQDSKWYIAQINDTFFIDYLTDFYECLEEDKIPYYAKAMEIVLKDKDIVSLHAYMEVLIKLNKVDQA